MKLRILVTGASGFIGSHLTSFLKGKGHEVTPYSLTKDPHFHAISLENFDAIIHLAGASIANGFWTKRRKHELTTSRINSTEHLASIVNALKNPPKVVIVASAVGYYGDQKERPLTEEEGPGHGFLALLAEKWEEAARLMKSDTTRVVSTRFGVVLSPEGGMLKRLLPLFKWGFGAIIGSGHQYVSWIALTDLLNVFEHVLQTPSLEGAVNCVSKDPVQQNDFAVKLAASVDSKVHMKLPRWVIKFFLGQKGKELFLFSQRAFPLLLEETGFIFQFSHLSQFFIEEKK